MNDDPSSGLVENGHNNAAVSATGESSKLEDPCEMCKVQRSKYSCPGCYTRTCSLSCVQLHKMEFECDGVAKRTKMVTMDQFDALTLLSDYRFLEEAKRVAARSVGLLNDTNNGKRDFKKVKHLLCECRRRSIRLELSPWGMAKSLTNTSTYNPVAETVFWRIEWIFVDADNYTIETDKNPESVKLDTLLRQFLKARHGCEMLIPTFYEENRFARYRPSPDPGTVPWSCYLKCERNGWTKDTRYYKLDNSKSICDNLSGKVIVEFPTVYVTCSGGTDSEDARFPLLTEDVKTSRLKKKVWEQNPVPRTIDEYFRLMDEMERPAVRPVRPDARGSKNQMAEEGKKQAASDPQMTNSRGKPELQAAPTQNCQQEVQRRDDRSGPPSTKSDTGSTAAPPMQPLRRLLRAPPSMPPSGHHGSESGKKMPWNPFAAKRVGKRKAIEDLAVALTGENVHECQKTKPKMQSPVKATERRYPDVFVGSKNTEDKKEKNDYFSLLGFHYASDGDSDLEEGEIK